eukprot:2943464-Alexandrium_andersonii.AAC.1
MSSGERGGNAPSTHRGRGAAPDADASLTQQGEGESAVEEEKTRGAPPPAPEPWAPCVNTSRAPPVSLPRLEVG